MGIALRSIFGTGWVSLCLCVFGISDRITGIVVAGSLGIVETGSTGTGMKEGSPRLLSCVVSWQTCCRAVLLHSRS